MMLLPRRGLLALVAVVDIALHARPRAVPAKALAERHALPPRHLEAVLQALVRHGILKGLRGPSGGYELARERRRISAGEVVRAVLGVEDAEAAGGSARSTLLAGVIAPAISKAGQAFLDELDAVTVEHLCRQAEARAARKDKPDSDFSI